MRLRPSFWIGLCLLLVLAGAWFFWPSGSRPAKQSPVAAHDAAAKKRAAMTPDIATVRSASTAPQLFTAANPGTNAVSATPTNPFPYRLTNTKKSLVELMGDRKAILLENALIDTGAKLDLGIPKNLSAAGDPGAYVVQSRGPVNAAFRAQLAAAGAEIISYIPNNAYLVRATPNTARQLAALTQSVIPYEPYYKVQSPLLAYAEKTLPPGGTLNLGLFPENSADTIAQIEKLGGTVLATDSSPFGPVVRVNPPKNWTALAVLPGVQIVEAYRQRIHANDLSRATVGVAADSVTTTNYLNLDGKNVLVQVNDSGIDATHPDLVGRVFGAPLTDTDGHGTHVAGIIAGNGTESLTVTNAQGSINPGTNFQYRGKAPKANLFSMPFFISDQTLQEAAALTNALISNNSWNYLGDTLYDLAAASYDAAVRDSLTQIPGSQPVLFVFSAGNDGGGSDDGGGGQPDSILSPATAKNVITVGAMEQLRNITNIVTDIDSNTAAVWQPETDQSSQVAGFSGRGNVGVGVEGPNGRYKPDVTAPGTFVVSTRSQQWDEAAYYNPTNFAFNTFINQTITNSGLNQYSLTVPANAVAVMITLVTNQFSTLPFPTNLPIYVEFLDRPPNPPTIPPVDFVRLGSVSIPPDSGGVITDISSLQNDFFFFAVGSTNASPVHYDLITTIVTTNDQGNFFEVLSNLNNSLGGDPSSTVPPHFYRYETGTSMAAADVSGVLALMQDFFINTLHTTPSPGLLKAMLINGARVTGNYSFSPANPINPEGWGQVNLPNTLPLSITNLVTNPTGGTNTSIYFLDQSVGNALATGDSQTFLVSLDTNSISAQLPLRVTLAWTDPAGNPAAAIKLVNNLDLVVTNLNTGDVFFGNDIPATAHFNAPWDTNGAPNLDVVNNIENVFLAPPINGRYSVTVIGREVNVNAVTAQTNNPAGVYGPNVVQDYSLVISCGGLTDAGEGPISVTANPVVSNPTGSQLTTFVTVTNAPLLNQTVGANTPLMGTNTIAVGTNIFWGTNGNITLGMTNQWHFFVVTNVLGFKFAAFVTFLPDTLSVPRTGVYANSPDNVTQPEADIDLYVADPHNPNIPNASTLTNLDPTVISAADKSLTRGGVESITYSNSALGDVYYIGVKSEAQEGSEFAFIPIFSATPFGSSDANGNQTLFGVPVPVNIPDATPTHPGKAYVFAISAQPIEVGRVVVTNTITHENFGDLIGTLSHNGTSVVLNNHASGAIPPPPGPYTKIYDDSGRGDIPGSQHSDGPGSLQNFQAQEGVGPWILTEVDTATNHVGAVTGLTLFIEKHRDLKDGFDVFIPPGSWFYTFLDVPPGFTNLSIFATNLPPTVTPPLQLYLNFNVQPDFSNFLDFVLLTNAGPLGPGNSISYGPPLRSGTYYVGLFNPSTVTTAHAFLLARLSGQASPIPPASETTNGPAVLDDAVSDTTVFVSSTQLVSTVSVGVVVNHPRISDLTFTLLSPTGQRVLLMENRGGTSTNGAGDMFLTTNNFAPVTATGGGLPQTNYLFVGQTSGSLTINWDFFQVPDEMTVYYGTNGPFNPVNAIFDTGLVSGQGTTNIIFGPGTFTDVTIIMNQVTNPAGAGGTAWSYTVGGTQTNYNYLMFTEDTNLTTVPIKYAIPPFTFTAVGTNYVLSDFELATNGDYLAPTNIFDAHGGWTLTNITSMLVGTNLVFVTNNVNMVSVVTDPANAFGGSNFLALASGSMFRQIPMTPGRQFSLSFLYRGPGISGWWRGEGNATDSSDPENLGNNGELIGRFSFPAGEVGQAFSMEFAGDQFQFAGTNNYVQIRQVPFPISVAGTTESNLPTTVLSSDLDVGTGPGFSVEGWINPTNVSFQQPLVEWLARTPTNLIGTNVVILAGPFLNRATSHYYYLLGSTNWTTSEFWATELGGHLVTIDTANEQNWVYDTFANYGGINRNLWIGLTNNAPANPTNYVWSSGLTNTGYFNWQTNQPNLCTGTEHYTAMLGLTNALPGLWFEADNNGRSCTIPPTNKLFGVVEVPELLPNGVQFWISVTNAPGTTNFVTGTNGCLFANLVDTTNGSHFIFSAPGLVQTNIYQHVALTYNTNSGIASLYYNGTNVASTNLGYFLPKTTGDVLLGRDMSLATNNYFGGKMDEMSIYGRSLSGAEILAIYNVSFLTTNRTLGKFDQSVTPALGLAEAQVSFGAFTNVLLGLNTGWQSQNYSFTVTSNSLPLQLSGMEPGMLLDSFNVSEQPLGNLDYLPEEPLSVLKGQNAQGTWTLQILDNRTGAYITNVNQLVSWQLQLVLQDSTLPSVPVDAETDTTISVPPGEIVDLTVAVPTWARVATNVLVSSTLPVDLLFNQTNAPTGNVPPDFLLLAGSTAGIGNPVLTTTPPSVPPLLPGQTYHLGVRNPGTHSATVVIRVDFDIPELTNGVPKPDVLTTSALDTEHYYVFNVTSNAYEATFQLLNLDGNADLVVRKGTPLPTLISSDYGSFNTTNADENIYVLTNSVPVPLSAGKWYLGVFKRDTGPVHYTVLAKELDVAQPPTIIPLTNGVPFNFTAGPGAALTNFFSFTVTNSPPSIQFQLYNLTGNGDLTVQTNAPPLAPPFFQSSQQPGVTPEFIFIATNSAQTNLGNTTVTNLGPPVVWYLGVPNHESTLINYTILALINTNLVFPAFPGAEGAGAGTLGGGSLPSRNGGVTNTVYHVTQLGDSGAGSLRDAVSSTNRTIVFDVSGTINLASPLVITNSYLTIAGQTAPGGGITVAGGETSVTNAHDVIIRYMRFRPGGTAASSTTVWSNGFEGGTNISIVQFAGSYFAGGWQVNSGSVDWLSNTVFGTPYQGKYFIDADGNGPGGISTNVTTVVGATYTLGFAYTKNPNSGSVPRVQVLFSGNPLGTISANIANSFANLQWQTTSFVFTATSPSTTLTFNSLDVGNPSGTFLDAISLTTNALASANSGNALRFVNTSNVIADHVSAEWSPLQDTAALDSKNLTVQWSMISDSLYSPTTSNGGSLLRFGDGALTFHHNLYANNFAGSPHLNDNLQLDFVNNVIYGWGTNAGFSFGTNNGVGFTNRMNYVCNYLIANANSFAPDIAFRGGSTNTWIFQTNNFIDSNRNFILDGAPTAWAMFTNQFTQIGQPFPLPPVATDEAFRAYERVLDFAGLSLMARDAVDTNIVTGVRNQTGTIITASGALPVIVSTLPPLDTDQDGIPDYWEITFGQFPTNVSNFLPSPRAVGYTDLEEYINWLGAPHALTITNTSVGVDLYQLCGNSGSLSFFLTNAVNGTVYLTNVLGSLTNTSTFSNRYAIFTPPADYSGFASFDFFVTNNATVAYFGPVTVSVVVSSVPIIYGTPNTNAPVFSVNSPTNQTIAELTTLTVTNTATDADTNQTLNYVVSMIVDTNAMTLNGWPLNFATTTPSPLISTNGIITWTPSEAQGPGVYIITTVVTDSGIPPLSATNSFSVTVNEINNAPVLPAQTNYNISALTTLVVTNTATDVDIPTNPLTYTLTVSPNVTNAVISTNGVITWTPNPAQLGLFTFTTIVTDTNANALVNQSLSATNVFTVFVSAVSAPFAFTEPAQAVTGGNAQLNGMATPNGLSATAWFQWGTTTNYGNLTPAVNVGAGYNVVYVTNQITGLLTNVPYHFRLVVSNLVGAVYGFDQILDEANVVVWGANYVGQSTVPAGLSNVTAIAGAYSHSLALNNNGLAVAWGDNTVGQVNVPAGLSNVVAVAGGDYYSMALKNNGIVTAWGANVFPGQTNVPAGLNNVVTISGGTISSLALGNNGSVVAWGANFSGLTNVPAGLSNAVAIAGGGLHSLAIKNDGTVVAWGDDGSGQTDVPAGLSNVVAIAGGNLHSLALKSDGTVVAWGDNNEGQTNVPAGLNNVVAIAAGGFHSLALRGDGSVVAWGDNSVGQTTVPGGLGQVVAIAGGYLHSMALTPQIFNPTNPIVVVLTNGMPITNTAFAGGTDYYQVNVPANADFATNTLFALNPDQKLNLWFSTNPPPALTTLLLAGVTNGISISNNISILSTNGAPTTIIPGRTYYLGVQNTNNFTVTYGIEVDFHLIASTTTPPQTNTIPITGIIYTNGGFLLTWFAPSNDLFQVQFSDSLTPMNWITFTNIISYNANAFTSPTNTQFNFFDDGSQYPFTGLRFYQLILLGSAVLSNTPPVLPPQATQTINPLNPLIVTNTATDAQSPPQTLTYTLTSSVIGANVPTIDTNTGVITWTPTVAQAGTSNTFTTVVTDNGTPNLSAANSFSVIVNPVPDISHVLYTNGNFLLTWLAPTNDIFAVQVATNLASPVWQTIETNITYAGPVTPTNGWFSCLDTGTPVPFGPVRFYRLILTGLTVSVGPPATNTAPVPPPQATRTINPLNPLTVTNTATDAQSPPQTLTYTLTSTMAGTNVPTINTNTGVITWTPTVAQSGTSNRLTTIVTDNGTPNLSATNAFSVIVNPVPDISNVTYTAGNFVLTWWAPTNDIFRVQCSDSLSPLIWQNFSNLVTCTGPMTATNGWFTFVDNGVEHPFTGLRFYQIVLVGVTSSVTPPATNAVQISSIISTNGNFLLTWFAPTTNQFKVQWTTNFLPPVTWTLFPGTNTSATGTFTFLDTNAPMLMKFYELILLP
ncbi:MAG TPA: S8 family serine peptidase [Verrucomicrobiae bacterium]|nr:S8 family serine peptidase [Verrucomicrobiae bacterium]